MTTPTSTPPPTADPSGRAHDGATGATRSKVGWAGIAFAVLFIVGFILAAETPDSDDASDAEWLSFYADDDNLRQIIIGGYLIILSSLAFLALAAGLLERARSTREASPVLHRVGWATGLLCAGFLMAGAVQLAGVAGNNLFGGYADVTDVDVLRQNFGIAFIVLPGVLCAVAFIAISTYLARQAGVFGNAMTVYSYLTAALLLLAVTFLPLILLPIWALVTGIALLRKG
jgi:hypothetical protein